MLAWVACGRLSAYFEADLNAWDSAAGVLLVREAGGFAGVLPADKREVVLVLQRQYGLVARVRRRNVSKTSAEKRPPRERAPFASKHI